MTKKEFYQRAVLAIASWHPIDEKDIEDSLEAIAKKARTLTFIVDEYTFFDK